MDNKLKKFKLEDGSVVDGGRIVVATSTNFCAIISLEGDSRLTPNSVQLSRDFIGRTDAQIGDLLYLDSDMNWAVSKEGWEEIEGEAEIALVPASSGQDDSLLVAREEAVVAREVAVGEAEGRLALRETALVEGEAKLKADVDKLLESSAAVEAVQQRNIKMIAEREDALAVREAAVVEAEAEVAKAKAELEAQAGSAKAAPSTKGIKVTGG